MFQRAHPNILIAAAVAVAVAAGSVAAGCSGESTASPPEPTGSTVADTPAAAGTPDATIATTSPATTPTTDGTAPPITSGAPATSDPGPAQAGMRRVAADRFSIVVPEAWQALLLDETGTITSDPADAPPLAQPLEQLALAAALQGGNLLAVPDGTASTNLLVVALGPEESPTEATLTDGFRARLAESGVTEMEVEMIDLPAGRAVHGQYVQTLESPDGPVTKGVASAYIALPTTSWLLTLTAPIGSPELAAFDEIARSFAPT